MRKLQKALKVMPAKGYKCGQYKFPIAGPSFAPGILHQLPAPELYEAVLRFPPSNMCVCLIFITLTNGVAHLSQNPFLRSVSFDSEKI